MFLSKCRVCFSDNIRMYELSKTRFQEIFEKNTGEKLIKDGRPGKVCYLCNRQLEKFCHLMEMSLKTEKYLSEFICNGIQKSHAHPVNQLHNLVISPVQYTSDSNIPQAEDDVEEEITAERDQDEGVNVKIESVDVDYEQNLIDSVYSGYKNRAESTDLNNQNRFDSIDLDCEQNQIESFEFNCENRIEPDNLNNENQEESIDLDYQEHLLYDESDNDDVSLAYEPSDPDVKDITIHEMALEEPDEEPDKRPDEEPHKEIDVVNTSNQDLEPDEEIDVVNTSNQDLLELRNITPNIFLPIVTLERISFNKISQFKNYNRQQKNKSYYNCLVCNFKCVYKQVLNRHMQVHNIKAQCKPLIHHKNKKNQFECVCNICEKRFEKPLYLKKHMKLHKTLQVFPCELCGKKYKHRSTFLVHMRTHTGEKPFGCKWCDKKFNDKSNCRKHVKSHSFSFTCYMCNRLFERESDLKGHVVEHIL